MKIWIHIIIGFTVLFIVGNMINNSISKVWHPITIIHSGVEK
jgi:hypothetical protein